MLIPWHLKWAAGNWLSIRTKLDLWALEMGYIPYTQAPQRYSLHGWGLLGFPPRIACNAIYHHSDGTKIYAAERFF